MQQAQKSEDDMFAMGMMEMGPPDKTFEYQQSLFEQLYDSDTGENKSLPGVSEAERYFMEAMAQHIDFSLFQDAPWDRKMCEPAAVYLKEHQSQLAKLRKISTWNQFYSPWVHESANKSKIRDFGHDVLFSAMDLLQMSAMYHLGNDRVDEAIKDCMAMDRLARPEWTSRLPNVVLKTFRYKLRKPVANTVLQIAFHPLATSSQLAELQRTLGNREATEPTGFDAEFRDATFRKLGLTSMTQATFLNLAPPSVEKNYPFQVWYVKNPTTVDWESWREAFDATRSKEQELIDAAHRGEIGSWEKERRLHEFKKLDGIDVHKADFYQYVFGRKLFTFVSSPKYKGKILGTIAADKILNFADYDIFYGQINRDFAKIALGLQRWKKQHGTWPDSLDQLAPEFLEVIPKDVISQQDFVYRKENSSFLLYSVGSNGIDDGGSNSDVMFEHPLPNLIEHHFQNRN